MPVMCSGTGNCSGGGNACIPLMGGMGAPAFILLACAPAPMAPARSPPATDIQTAAFNMQTNLPCRRSPAHPATLLGAQSDGGVDPGGAPCRKPASGAGNGGEQGDDAKVRHPVESGDAVEQADQRVAPDEGSVESDKDAEGCEAHTVAQDHGQDVAA